MKKLVFHPLVRIFTTIILCLMLVSPFIQNIYDYSDNFVIVFYWSTAVYVLIKKIYDIYTDSPNITES